MVARANSAANSIGALSRERERRKTFFASIKRARFEQVALARSNCFQKALAQPNKTFAPNVRLGPSGKQNKWLSALASERR